MVKTCQSPGACLWIIRKRNYAGLPIVLFWKKAGVERIQGGGSLRRSSGVEGKGAGGGQEILKPEAVSSGQFCEKPFKLYFKAKVGGKCSHLCLSAKSKLPSAAEDNCVNSTRLCICQMVISKEASHLCRDLTLCSMFSQLWFSGSLWQTRREAGRCCHFKGGNMGAWRVGGRIQHRRASERWGEASHLVLPLYSAPVLTPGAPAGLPQPRAWAAP